MTTCMYRWLAESAYIYYHECGEAKTFILLRGLAVIHDVLDIMGVRCVMHMALCIFLVIGFR